ncbi:hypothetical protein CDIK_0522 [Cucumispora dikerogammari]|nr:hypothetical protein CDIK_0522 [Cucumispora dikerogammari]
MRSEMYSIKTIFLFFATCIRIIHIYCTKSHKSSRVRNCETNIEKKSTFLVSEDITNKKTCVGDNKEARLSTLNGEAFIKRFPYYSVSGGWDIEECIGIDAFIYFLDAVTEDSAENISNISSNTTKKKVDNIHQRSIEDISKNIKLEAQHTLEHTKHQKIYKDILSTSKNTTTCMISSSNSNSPFKKRKTGVSNTPCDVSLNKHVFVDVNSRQASLHSVNNMYEQNSKTTDDGSKSRFLIDKSDDKCLNSNYMIGTSETQVLNGSSHLTYHSEDEKQTNIIENVAVKIGLSNTESNERPTCIKRKLKLTECKHSREHGEQNCSKRLVSVSERCLDINSSNKHMKTSPIPHIALYNTSEPQSKILNDQTIRKFLPLSVINEPVFPIIKPSHSTYVKYVSECAQSSHTAAFFISPESTINTQYSLLIEQKKINTKQDFYLTTMTLFKIPVFLCVFVHKFFDSWSLNTLKYEQGPRCFYRNISMVVKIPTNLERKRIIDFLPGFSFFSESNFLLSIGYARKIYELRYKHLSHHILCSTCVGSNLREDPKSYKYNEHCFKHTRARISTLLNNLEYIKRNVAIKNISGQEFIHLIIEKLDNLKAYLNDISIPRTIKYDLKNDILNVYKFQREFMNTGRKLKECKGENMDEMILINGYTCVFNYFEALTITIAQAYDECLKCEAEPSLVDSYHCA